MKIERLHKIGLFDVDCYLYLSLQSVARFFQEISTFHSLSVGDCPQTLFRKGVAWFLHRLEIDFASYPRLDDQVKIITWVKKINQFKAFREYLIQSDKGEIIARGSSVSLLFDLKTKQIVKVWPDISRLYEILDENLFTEEIDDWKTCGKIDPEQEMELNLRYLDFDVNQHVNNTVFLGLLETLYYKTISSNKRRIKNIKIRFCREIGKDKESIQSGWQNANGIYKCNIFDHSKLFADAEISPMG